MENILFIPGPNHTECVDIGGKGMNLLRLQQQVRVPDWVAVPVSAWLEILHREPLGKRIAARLDENPTDDAATAKDIQSWILDTPLPPEWIDALEAIPFIGGPEAGYVAVRSSAGDEDGATHSFAGVHESYLYVRGAESVARHIRRVWASGYQERAILYRRTNGLTRHPVPMAVLIQRMVDPVSSGVVFTADPTAQNPLHVVVSALYGLGEGLVGAGLAADDVRYDKRTRTVETITALKVTQYELDKETGEGVREVAVPPAKQEPPALTDRQRDEIIRTALDIEQTRRRPQDIEFCFDCDGVLYILQTRDITTITDYGPAAGPRRVWDNANIIESYSGVTTPMTFSFIRHAYTVVYHCFSEVMGIPRSGVQAHRHIFENMLGLIRGQVYYNLVNWYRLIQQFPGYGMNKRHMESMMGLREQFDPETERSDTSRARKWLIEFPLLLRLGVRMLWQFSTLDRRVDRFQSRFYSLYERWEAMPFDDESPDTLMNVYREMEARLLWNWQAPIINDFYVMIHYGLLRKLCHDWCGDESHSLQNDLICGNGDIESTEPTRLLMRLALRIRQQPEWRKLFNGGTPLELARRVPSDPAYKEIADEIDVYLKRYGFRCIDELKLESPSLRETPEFVYQMLQNYLLVDESMLDTDAMTDREQKIRRQAETQAHTALRARSCAWIRKQIFMHVLRAARKGVRNRENMRFARTRIYGVLRELIQAMGRQLVAAGKLAAMEDIFYLTIDEIWDFVKGTAVTTDLQGLVDVRRREFETYRQEDVPAPDDHFDTYGMVYLGNSFKAGPTTQKATGDLKGIGCCPGEVTAPIRIVQSPRDDLQLNGCILVASRTDPGWVPLYPAVSGILVERGSILSHSAIVAREMGIPAIVGIQGLLDTLTDGEIVTMNGETGQITRQTTQASPNDGADTDQG